MLPLTAEPRGRPAASSMYHIIIIKIENIPVDEIGRHTQNEWSVMNQIEYTGFRQDSYL